MPPKMGGDQRIIRVDSKDAGKRANQAGKETNTILHPSGHARRAAEEKIKDKT